MVNYTSPDRTYDAGVPSQSTDNFLVAPEGFITGETPRQVVQDLPTAESQDLAAYEVVGLNANGQVVPAITGSVDPANDVQAIGFVIYPVVSGVGENPVARVLRAACVNPFWANIVWDASYASDADKMTAFEGAPSPTQIVTRPLAQYTPVAP